MVIFFNEFALAELEDTIEYYELQLEGLGNIFKEEILKGLKSIKKHPDAWPAENGNIRKFILFKFPFKILYSIEPDRIYILAIAHFHRKPQYYAERE